MVNALLSVVVYFVLQWRRLAVPLASCVGRQGHDRSAVHQLDTDRSGRRAGRGNSGAGEGLADFRFERRRPHRRRRRAADAARRCFAAGAPGHGRSVCAQHGRTCGDRAGAVGRPAIGRAADPRTFAAADRCRPRRYRRDRKLRHAMRHRPPRQSAGLGVRSDCRSRYAVGGARTDRECLCRTRAVLMGSHRRTPRPSRRDPGIDAGAGGFARRDAARAGRQALRHPGAVRGGAELAQRRSRACGLPARRSTARP